MPRMSLAIAALAALVACAAPQSMSPVGARPFRPSSGEVIALDHLLVVIDVSASVSRDTMFLEERALLEAYVASAPDGDYEAGAVAFGGFQRTSYPLAPFDRDKLRATTAEIEHLDEGTPLYKVLDESREAFASRRGRAAVVIFSDGVVTDEFGRDVDSERSIVAARDLAGVYDGTVCFHTLQLGDSEQGGALLQSLSEVTGCGSHRRAISAADEAQLHAFHRDVFIGVGSLPPVGAQPPDFAVSSVSGSPDGPWSLRFGFDSAAVDSRYQDAIDSVAREFLSGPGARIRIDGHSDTWGNEAYNRDLSSRRAVATRDALVRSGVPRDRIEVQGHGPDRPAFPNSDLQNRRANRRADIEIVR